MKKNIENGNFVTGGQNHAEEENNMLVKTFDEAEMEEFLNGLKAGSAPSFSFDCYDVNGYSKFKNEYEMSDPNAFLVLLYRNDDLRNSLSGEELKEKAKKYAKECIEARTAAMEKTSKRVYEALEQRGFPGMFERSMGMTSEEVEDFMEYVKKSEWLQYVEQTADEIQQALTRHCSKATAESMAKCAIEECERRTAEYELLRQFA